MTFLSPFQTFTGPYVYQLQSVICDADLRSLLRSMGYSRDQELQYHVRDHPGGASHLRQLSFELLLAQAECRLLSEVVSMSRGFASELEAVDVRRNTREDAAGCADAPPTGQPHRRLVPPVGAARGSRPCPSSEKRSALQISGCDGQRRTLAPSQQARVKGFAQPPQRAAIRRHGGRHEG